MKVQFREKFSSCLNKLIDKGIVFFTTDTFMTVSEIHWIIQQFFTVGTSIDDKRHNASWINSGCCSVDHEFSNRDVNPLDTPVTDTKDSFCVSCNNQADIAIASRIFQCFFDIFWVVNIKVSCVLWVYKEFRILFNGVCDHWIIDDWVELNDVLVKEVVEKSTVCIENFHQEKTFFKV